MVELDNESGAEDNNELQRLKASFILVICADYQQTKLIPYWGNSPQPGVMYYPQKISYNVFGIVDCRDDQGYVSCARNYWSKEH